MAGVFPNPRSGRISLVACGLALSACASSADRVSIPPPHAVQGGTPQFSAAGAPHTYPASDSPLTYGGQPRPRFSSEIPPPAAIPPGFRKPTAAEAEEQRESVRDPIRTEPPS